MSQLFTVDPNNDSTQLIPTTPENLEKDLLSPVVKVYVYIGKESDPGWDAALETSGLLANLHPYLARVPRVTKTHNRVPLSSSTVLFTLI